MRLTITVSCGTAAVTILTATQAGGKRDANPLPGPHSPASSEQRQVPLRPGALCAQGPLFILLSSGKWALGPESWGHISTLEPEGPPCQLSPRTAMSPVHAQLLSGVVGRFQKQAGNHQSLVATESGGHSGQPTGSSSTETQGLPGGQDAGLQPGPHTVTPNPRRTALPRTPAPSQPDIRTFSSELLQNSHTAPLCTFLRS